MNFKQERNINQLFEDTFTFVKENYKTLGIMLLNWAGPFVLIMAIASTYLEIDVAAYASESADILMQFEAMTASFYYWPMAIFKLISDTVIMAVVFAYIQAYIKKGVENILQEEVLEEVKANFLIIFATNFIVNIAVLVGIIAIVIGSIFLFVALSLVVFIRFYEKKLLWESFNKSLYLVKDNWWDTAIKIITIYIIIFLISLSFNLPSGLYSAVSGYALDANMSDPSIIAIILKSFAVFASRLIMAILYIGIVFIYFNLIEKKEASSLHERINNF